MDARRVLVVLILAGFAALGVAHVFNPAFFVKRSGARKGGQLLNEWNELGFQIVGLIIAIAAVCGIYQLFTLK